MRIAYFIDTVIPSPRANTVHVMKMCGQLAKNGNDVTLFCDTDKKTFDTKAVFEQYGVEECFKIKPVYLSDFLIKHGHRFTGLFSAWKKSKKTDGYDLLYGRSLYSLFFARRKGKYIYEAHAASDRINSFLEKKIFKNKNFVHLIVISGALKEYYLKKYPFLCEKDVTVLHDGADAVLDLDGEKAVLKNIDPAQKVNIGYLGHLYPGKCMEVLLPVAKRRPDYTFHIVGGTDEWINYWKEKAISDNIENVIFHGFVSHSQVGKYYRAFDICVMPFSRDIYVSKNKNLNIGSWISPLKLFEAMSYGKPILVSKIPSIEEVLSDGKDCLFADPDNIGEWTEKLDILVKDGEMRERIGNEARRTLENGYTWARRAEKVIETVNCKR